MTKPADIVEPPVTTDPDLWLRAATFAARAHKKHLRKDRRTPYVAHVYRVAMIVRHLFGCHDDAVLAAAMLHDTIEDTPTDYDEIAERFGTDVADMVAALTKNMFLPEPEREADYERRLVASDWRVRLIKLADVMDNATDGMGKASKLKRRCKLAIELAEPDAARHPETARAIEVVRALPILTG
ncbi:MAG: HD domain-containing protein [Phycisphaerales bacterium]